MSKLVEFELKLAEIRYATVAGQEFIGEFIPYEHQLATLKLVREAFEQKKTICLLNASVTGSGKTLANFAATILDGFSLRTIGVYPTNELVKDQLHTLRNRIDDNAIASLTSDDMVFLRKAIEHLSSNAQALSWVTGSMLPQALLTNPDILYIALFNLYGQMFTNFHESYGVQVFQNILKNYPVIAFDEFHLYNPKQAANAAFIVGMTQKLVPDAPHIFIFSSATPLNLIEPYLKKLDIDLQVVSSTPTTNGQGRIVCEPLEIAILTADLGRWQGGDVIRENLDDILAWADQQMPPAKGVFIVDSVYEAKRLAAELRQRYAADQIGEVHGYMDDTARRNALTRRFSIGTTTIDVGVDLTDTKSKDFLVCEARGAAQAIQRIGRLGRGGREPLTITTPNRVWLVVPAYVCERLKKQWTSGSTISRLDFNQFLTEEYKPFETFGAYTSVYSPQETIAACERIKKHFFSDLKAEKAAGLEMLVSNLFNPKFNPKKTANEAEIADYYARNIKKQQLTWKKYGIPVKTSWSKDKYFLSDLESFRGGMETDFTVIIYDDLDVRAGFKPVKSYGLPFIVRRTEFDELSRTDFTNLLQRKHPAKAEKWLAELDDEATRALGFVRVKSLVEGKARDFHFELDQNLLNRLDFGEGKVVRTKGLRVSTVSQKINKKLAERELNCWISQRNSFNIGTTLPPLFAIYPLLLTQNGMVVKGKPWSIAFGLDAFFLQSIGAGRNFSKTKDSLYNKALIL